MLPTPPDKFIKSALRKGGRPTESDSTLSWVNPNPQGHTASFSRPWDQSLLSKGASCASGASGASGSEGRLGLSEGRSGRSTASLDVVAECAVPASSPPAGQAKEEGDCVVRVASTVASARSGGAAPSSFDCDDDVVADPSVNSAVSSAVSAVGQRPLSPSLAEDGASSTTLPPKPSSGGWVGVMVEDEAEGRPSIQTVVAVAVEKKRSCAISRTEGEDGGETEGRTEGGTEGGTEGETEGEEDREDEGENAGGEGKKETFDAVLANTMLDVMPKQVHAEKGGQQLRCAADGSSSLISAAGRLPLTAHRIARRADRRAARHTARRTARRTDHNPCHPVHPVHPGHPGHPGQGVYHRHHKTRHHRRQGDHRNHGSRGRRGNHGSRGNRGVREGRGTPLHRRRGDHAIKQRGGGDGDGDRRHGHGHGHGHNRQRPRRNLACHLPRRRPIVNALPLRYPTESAPTLEW